MLVGLGGVRPGPLSYMCVGAFDKYCIRGLAVYDCVFYVISYVIAFRVVACFTLMPICVIRPDEVRVWRVDGIDESIFLWGCCCMVRGLRMHFWMRGRELALFERMA
jgi:hypothetical protein